MTLGNLKGDQEGRRGRGAGERVPCAKVCRLSHPAPTSLLAKQDRENK